MEKRLNKKLEGYITTFKENIREKLSQYDNQNNTSNNTSNTHNTSLCMDTINTIHTVHTIETPEKCSSSNEQKQTKLTMNEINELIQYIYDYDRLTFNKEDFQKRKRVKNFVPIYDRCGAKRANNEKCTRRKKDGYEYCGTHLKGIPHGIIDTQEETKNTTQKIEVQAQEIQGIVYYIDKNNNVYQTEDVISNKLNPKIIAKYVKE